MPFGSVLSKVGSVTLRTQDNKTVVLNSSLLARIALNIFGIPHMGTRIRSREIMRIAKNFPEGRFLDAGCGYGLYALHLYNKRREIFGIDLDKEKINVGMRISVAAHSIDRIHFSKGDLKRLDFNNEFFDCILCTEVLEHIEEDYLVIKELARVLKKGGILIITVPSRSPFTENIKNMMRHTRAGYEKDDMIKLFNRYNLKTVAIKGYLNFFGRFAWNINRLLFRSKVLTCILFYPLFWLSALDNFFHNVSKPGGYLFWASKER